MYLTKTEQIPSYNVSNLWINLSNHIGLLSNKNIAYKREFKAGNAIVTLTNEAISFNQKDKLIFEMVLYQYQQKQYPDILTVNLEQLCQDLGYKTHKHKIKYVFDRLKLFSMFRALIYNHSTEQVAEIDFSDIVCSLDDYAKPQVCINFNGKNRTPLRALFDAKGQPKKYIIPFKSEYELLVSEFLQLKTTTKSKTSKHPFTYRYRNFKLIDILQYIRKDEIYNLAEEFFDDKHTKQIKDTITRTLNKLTKYGKQNNIPIPKYRYNSKTGMYEIKDFNYPDQRTEREILLDIEDKSWEN